MTPARRRSSSALHLAGGLALCAALMLAAVPTAHAGAVFEIREAVPTNSQDYEFRFNDKTEFRDVGSIVRSGTDGAGKFFKSSAIPLAIFTLNKCKAVAPHIHPNAAETLFVLKGKIRIHQVRGEEDGNRLRSIDLSENEAGYIQQGAFHTVENIGSGTAQFLQIFDHPQGGAVFVSPSLVALPRNLVNSAFSEDVLDRDTTAKGALVPVRGCRY